MNDAQNHFLIFIIHPWAADGFGAFVKNMGVDHGGFDIFVAEQFLNSADVVTCFKQMGGKGVPKGVRRDALIYFGETGGIFDGFLQVGFVEMVALRGTAARVFG